MFIFSPHGSTHYMSFNRAIDLNTLQNICFTSPLYFHTFIGNKTVSSGFNEMMNEIRFPGIVKINGAFTTIGKNCYLELVECENYSSPHLLLPTIVKYNNDQTNANEHSVLIRSILRCNFHFITNIVKFDLNIGASAVFPSFSSNHKRKFETALDIFE